MVLEGREMMYVLTETAPDVTVCGVNFQNGAQVLYSGWKSILGTQDAGNALHSRYRPLVELQGLLVTLHGAVVVLHLLG